MSRKVVSWLASLLLFVSIVTARAEDENDPFSQIDSIVKTLSEITGLTEKHTVPYGRMSKRQLRRFLNKRIKKTLKPDEIYADELSLKMFGLVPQDFDLKKSTIDLLTEQAAAFYDYDEKKLFLLEGASFSAETTTLAHELSHALADQHFNLGKYMEDSPSNDDENLAHTAVVEGEASWLMIAYELKQSGQPPVPTPDMLKTVADSSDGSMADYPVLKNSPLYIQESLLFPYSEGIVFFDKVYKRLGQKAFAAVFQNPPTDTAQIMQPEKYFAHERPAKPGLPSVDSDEKMKSLTEGSMGEFDHSILLRQYLGNAVATDLSGHLRGGNFQILALGKTKRPVLLYASEWDSASSAAAFFADYKKILHSKWKRFDETKSGKGVYKGLGDNGYFESSLRGNCVTSVEGLPSPMTIGY